MTGTRIALGAAGLAGLLWGVWSLLDDGTEALVSVAIWLAGGVVLHDAMLAPLTIAICFLGARFLPRPARGPAAIAFLVWAACSLAFVAVLSGQGGKPGNDTILDRDYGLAWIVFTLVLAVAAATVSVARARHHGAHEPPAPRP